LTCPSCTVRVSAREITDGWCETCGKKLPPSLWATSSARGEDRPWTPLQVLAVSLLFGPAACGVIAGINFARMGKRLYVIPSILVGSVLFLLEVWVILFLVPEEAARLVGLLANVGVGLGFLLVQKPSFDAWKSTNWAPAKEGESYIPTRIGQLFLVSLVCLGIQVGVMILVFAIGGKG